MINVLRLYSQCFVKYSEKLEPSVRRTCDQTSKSLQTLTERAYLSCIEDNANFEIFEK